MHRRVAARTSTRLCPPRAHNTLSPSSPTPSSPSPPTSSHPSSSLTPHLAALRSSLLSLLGAGHPALPEVTQYYFKHPSKQVRPLIVLLMARATNGLGSGWEGKLAEARAGVEQVEAESNGTGKQAEGGKKKVGKREKGTQRKSPGDIAWELDMRALDRPIGRSDVLNDWNPLLPIHTAAFTPGWAMRVPPPRLSPFPRPSPVSNSTQSTSPSPKALAHTLLPTQSRLAQIVEMMHTASLLHDDVIDGSPLRRCAPSAPSLFTPKLAVLAGNFVLGRASVALSRLGEREATELIAGVLANLVDGEMLQLREVKVGGGCGLESGGLVGGVVSSEDADDDEERRKEVWNVYLQKTYLKTASLMAKGARASVVLGGCLDGDGVVTSEGRVFGEGGVGIGEGAVGIGEAGVGGIKGEGEGMGEGAQGERHVLWKDVAYAYGRNLGIAFQLVDDVLDYEADAPPPPFSSSTTSSSTPSSPSSTASSSPNYSPSSSSASTTPETSSPALPTPNALGKPGGADLGLGLATGPALYAWEEHPAMGALIGRGFKGEGDVEAARAMVHASEGVQRTRALAQAYADAAVAVLQVLPPSEARDALEGLARVVIGRKS